MIDNNDNETLIQREVPEVTTARRALVSEWTEKLHGATQRWAHVHKRMKADMLFAAGAQWPDQKIGETDSHYVANITLRHINQRVASLYGRDPVVKARRRPRLLATVWDESIQSLQEAIKRVTLNPVDAEAMAIVEEARAIREHTQLMNRIGKTLEIVYRHDLGEQSVPFKQSMKSVVRRAATTGIGWIKLGFQRIMRPTPDAERQIADAQERLLKLEQLAADIADGETAADSAEVEQARLLVKDLTRRGQEIVREGLVYDFPEPTAIIPDPKCRNLRGFVGCDWVAERFLLSRDTVQQVYGIDVGKSFLPYKEPDPRSSDSEMDPGILAALQGGTPSRGGEGCVCVWEIYNRPDGLIYTVADGFPDFLREPASPEIELESFWPWRPVMWNEVALPGEPWPRSDVELIRDMQVDYNRARQGLREHRRANAPLTVYSAGALEEQDVAELKMHPPYATIGLQGLKPGDDVGKLLQKVQKPGIDPNVYDPSASFQDIQRVVGTAEANLGGTSAATATESSIAEQSRVTSADAAVDDLDTTLSDLARCGAQILLMELSPETVRRIAGPGAAWPQATKRDVMDELYLDVEAGSSGVRNQMLEAKRLTELMPMLAQTPGIRPDFLAKRLLNLLDDDIDFAEAYAENAPSIAAMNAMQGEAMRQQMMGGMGAAPGQQGPQGAMNAPTMPGAGGIAGPRVPDPRDGLAAQGGQRITN